MIKSKLQQAVNDQITAELWSSQLYLQMSYFLKHKGWEGFARWMKCHSDEEREHATRMADFLTDRGGKKKHNSDCFLHISVSQNFIQSGEG